LLGETVRRLRCEKGWSVLQLSKRSGVPEQVIEGLESGGPYVPSEANTALLAEALGLPAGPMLVERERLSERYWGAASASRTPNAS
jgi:transcriptional regulator with XRE-family HTH domain